MLHTPDLISSDDNDILEHMAEACEADPDTEDPVLETVNVGLFFKTYPAIIDSGSSRTVIRGELADFLRTKIGATHQIDVRQANCLVDSENYSEAVNEIDLTTSDGYLLSLKPLLCRTGPKLGQQWPAPVLIGRDAAHLKQRIEMEMQRFTSQEDTAEPNTGHKLTAVVNDLLWDEPLKVIRRVLHRYYVTQFSNVFVESVNHVRPSRIPPVKLGLEDAWESRIVSQRPLRLSPPVQKVFSTVVNILKNNDMVAEGDPNFPVVRPLLISKGPGQLPRLCIQPKGVNAVTCKRPMEALNAYQCLHSIPAAHEVMTVFDIAIGFYQIRVREPDTYAQQFYGPDGEILRFLTIGMGTKNGTAIFHEELKALLRGVPADNFVDDVWQTAASPKELHINTLWTIGTLAKWGLQVIPFKLNVMTTSANVLSIKWSKGELKPAPKWKQRAADVGTVEEALKLIAALQYYSPFVSNFSKKALPFRKAKTGQLTDDLKLALVALTEEVANSAIALDDWTTTPTLWTDWSEETRAAVLTINGKCVGQVSATNHGLETKLAPPDGELMTGAWAMQKFRYHLALRHFIWKTDAEAVVKAANAPHLSAFMARRVADIMSFDFEVVHVKGTHQLADYWSRVSPNHRDPPVPPAVTPVIYALDDSEAGLTPESHHKKYHMGWVKTHQQLKSLGWTGTRAEVMKAVASCTMCRFLNSRPVRVQLRPRTDRPARVMDTLSIDVTYLDKQTNAYILGVQDTYSKRLFAHVFNRYPTAKGIRDFISKLPGIDATRIILADNHPCFMGEFVEWMLDMGMDFENPPRDHHQGNGQIERAFRTMKNRLLATRITEPGTPITEIIRRICESYNATSHSTTKVSTASVDNADCT